MPPIIGGQVDPIRLVICGDDHADYVRDAVFPDVLLVELPARPAAQRCKPCLWS